MRRLAAPLARTPLARTVLARTVLCCSLALLVAAPTPARCAPEETPADPAETPEAAARRLRRELDERFEKLPGSAQPAAELMAEFRDRDFRVWSSLRDKVVAMGTDAVPAAVLFLEELDWETRAFASSCLARIGDRSSAAAVADAYHGEEKYTEARRQHLLALAAIGAESSKGVLAEALKNEDPGIRLAALRGLGRFNDPKYRETLRPFAEQTKDLDLRYEALGALVELTDEPAITTLLEEAKALVANRKLERVDSLVQKDNGDRYSQYLLGQTLARGNGKEVDKVLFAALLAKKPYDHKDFLRMGAAEGLGRRAAREGKIHPELISGINDKDSRVRAACTFAAGWIGSEELTGRLVKNLGDSQLDVRHNVVVALGRIGTPAAVKGLTRALKDRAGEIRIGALRALGQIQGKDATKGLVNSARDAKYMIRVMAARQLALRTTEPGVLKALRSLARDPDYGVRAQALAALAHHPDGNAVLDPILNGLKDKDFGVRANACLAVAAIHDSATLTGHEQAIRRIVQLYLNADEPRLHKAAEEALDAARPPSAVEPLIAALESKSSETAKRANLGLQRIGETSRNFDPEASPRDRAAGAKRWSEWWAGRDGKLPARGSRARMVVTGSLVDVAKDLKWKGLDIALLFDSTYSMAGLIRAAKERLDEIIDELGLLLPSLRVSVYSYRDYGDNFVFWGTPLTYDTSALSGFLQNATHGQGGDLPEAVYDTCKNAMDNLQWRPNAHKVIVYAGDAPHHPEQHADFIRDIKAFCTVKNQAVLHALFTDTERRSLDIGARKKRVDQSRTRHPFFEKYQETAEAGRGRGVMLDDESALIKELLVLTFGEAWRADIENLLDFEY